MSALQVRTEALALDGTVVDTVSFGEGAKTLVLLPGLRLHSLRENGRALAYMYRRFAEGYRVYILDCGRDVGRECTIAALAADTGRALDALGIRGADVFGISMGGMIAQYLALDRPELVQRLVLAVTLSRPNDTLRRTVQQWVELSERGAYDELMRDVMDRTYSDGFRARLGRLLPAVSRACSPAELERFTALARACLTCDTYDRLGAVRCPALVIGGRRDGVVSGQASEELAERLDCELVMYDALGHGVCEEAPKDICARVLAFLQK